MRLLEGGVRGPVLVTGSCLWWAAILPEFGCSFQAAASDPGPPRPAETCARGAPSGLHSAITAGRIPFVHGGNPAVSSSIQGMRLEAIAAYVPGEVWSNARVAARLRLERMRLSARAKRTLRGPI